MAEENKEKIEELETRIKGLEELKIAFEQFKLRGFQLKFPLDTISEGVIKNIMRSEIGSNLVITTGLVAGFTLTPTSSYHTLSATAARDSNTSTAIKNGSFIGQILVLEGTSDTNTITIKNSANTVLGSDAVLGANDILVLVWNDTDWIEVTRSSSGAFTSKARAYRDSSTQSIDSGSATKVQLNAESYDVDSEFDSTTNYRFTATVEGYYQVNAVVKYSATVDTKIYVTIIRRNGTDIATSQLAASGTEKMGIVVADVVFLTAGQFLELFTFHDSGSAKTIENGESLTYMSVHRLS